MSGSEEGRSPVTTSQINLHRSAEKGFDIYALSEPRRGRYWAEETPNKTGHESPPYACPGNRAVLMHVAKTWGFDVIPHQTATLLSQPRLCHLIATSDGDNGMEVPAGRWTLLGSGSYGRQTTASGVSDRK